MKNKQLLIEFINDNREEFKKHFNFVLFGCHDKDECFNQAVASIIDSWTENQNEFFKSKDFNGKIAYLKGAFKNKALSIIEKCKCPLSSSIDDLSPEIELLVVHNQYVSKYESIEETVENKLYLEFLLSDLSPEEKELIIKIFFEDKTVEEISKEMNLKSSTVRKRKQRVIEKIRDKLP
jgi:RNA polymerase sigma factor (sigma-70 family)